MKEKFLDFFNNFSFSDLINFISDINVFDYLLSWKIITVVLLLVIISMIERWRTIVLSLISYTAASVYLFIVMVILKNSDISEPSAFIFMLSHLVGGIGLGVYRYLMK